MDIVYTPLSQCKTCLQKQNHYGQDDPCLWPQPFGMQIGHLAVVPSPHLSEMQPLYWAWYYPVSTDFDPYWVAGLSGMVQLSASLQDRVIKMCSAVSASVSTLPKHQKSNSLLTWTRDQLCKCLEFRMTGWTWLPQHCCFTTGLSVAHCPQGIHPGWMVEKMDYALQWYWLFLQSWSYSNGCFYRRPRRGLRRVSGGYTYVADFTVTKGVALTPIDCPVAPLSESFDHKLPVCGSHGYFFDACPGHPRNSVSTGPETSNLSDVSMILWRSQSLHSCSMTSSLLWICLNYSVATIHLLIGTGNIQ